MALWKTSSEIQGAPPIVDNEEGSVLLEVAAHDDIGVVRLDISTADGRKIFAHEFYGYFSAPLIPGDSQATVQAYDASGQWSESILPFAYASANRLFLTRFEEVLNTENGQVVEGWVPSANGIIKSDDPAHAFLGGGYISFSGDHWLERSVTVPAEATQVRLGYRYRVKENLGAGSCLRVEILDVDGQLLEIAQMITFNDDTTQEYSNNYKKHTYTLANTYAGQTIRIRFQSLAAAADDFRIDQAFMVYDGVPVVDMMLAVDETEGSVIFTPQLSGVSTALVDYVGIFVNGVQVAQPGYWPYQVIFPTSAFSPDVLRPAVAIAYDHFGNIIAGSSAEWFQVKSIHTLILNGDFENGTTHWARSGEVDLANFNPAAGEGPPAFLGTGCMVFTGEGVLAQSFTVPGHALSAKLVFRVQNASQTGDVELGRKGLQSFHRPRTRHLGLTNRVHGYGLGHLPQRLQTVRGEPDALQGS